jgi:hypothetical protein
MKTIKQPQQARLTAEQEAFKQLWLPKPPEDLTETAKRLFQAAINKVECKPTTTGSLEFNYSKLTHEECFAIGVSVFDPKSVRDKKKDLWQRRILRDPTGREVLLIIQPSSQDTKEAIARVRETARKEILVAAHGEKFPIARRSGSLNPIHQYLVGLYKRTKPSDFDAFWAAIRSQVDARKHKNVGLVTLQDIDEDTLFYAYRGAERKIGRATIRNNMKKYKASSH